MTSLGAVRRDAVTNFWEILADEPRLRSRPNPRPRPARTEASLDRTDRNRGVSKTETGPDRHISRPDRPKTEAQTSVGLGRSKFRPVGPGRPKVGPARANPDLDSIIMKHMHRLAVSTM